MQAYVPLRIHVIGNAHITFDRQYVANSRFIAAHDSVGGRARAGIEF